MHLNTCKYCKKVFKDKCKGKVCKECHDKNKIKAYRNRWGIDQMKPKISVLIPVFNGEKYIEQAIDSALNQNTKVSYEIVIIDDGSNDNTYNLLKKYKSNKKIRIYKNIVNLGISAAKNKLVSKSKGIYLAWLAADDLFNDNFLETMYNFALKYPNKILFSNYDIIDPEGNIIRTYDLKIHLRYLKLNDKETILKGLDFIKEVIYFAKDSNMFCNYSTIFGNKSYFEKDNNFWEGIRYGEDFYHWLKMSLVKKTEFLHIPIHLIKYRVHPNSTTLNNINDISENNKKTINRLMEELNVKPEIYSHKLLQKYVSKKDTLLSLMSGTGEDIEFIDCKEITCVDIYKPYLDKITKKVNKISLDSLSYIRKQKDKSFDVIFCIDGIEHLTKIRGIKLLREMFRVAKKRIIIYTPDGYTNNFPHNQWGIPGGDIYNVHRSGWIKNEFIKLGFRIDNVTEADNIYDGSIYYGILCVKEL